MGRFLGTAVGKSVRLGLAYRRGGGHTLPGLVTERLFPDYMKDMLESLPDGVVVITGTNGKTTTTKMVVELLEGSGKKVLTNQTGSNLTRGITSAITRQAKISGRLDKDIAVLELDEATARRLVEQVKPRWVLALNVSRDQLDRFGEVDTVASYVAAAMAAATDGIITNSHDPNLIGRAKTITAQSGASLSLFGAAPSLAKYFPSDYELAAVNESAKNSKTTKNISANVELAGFKDQNVTYKIGDRQYETDLKLTGQHNFLNGAAALALCLKLLPDTPPGQLVERLSKVELAFGRGEVYHLKNGAQIELVLVKNPASFTQALASYSAKNTNLMIAINDKIADGRDVSWLWDVNFEPLAGDVLITSGRRAADMALRLSYDDISAKIIEASLPKAVRILSEAKGPKVALATYTAMLQLYKFMTKQGKRI